MSLFYCIFVVTKVVAKEKMVKNYSHFKDSTICEKTSSRNLMKNMCGFVCNIIDDDIYIHIISTESYLIA